MQQHLQCVIIGDTEVIKDDNQLPYIEKLIDFLIHKNIQPVILSNRNQAERIKLRKSLTHKFPSLQWFIAKEDGTPYKPKPESVKFLLDSFQFQPNQALYIGNSKSDMQTAVNSNLLFLNASWYGKQINYGLEFKTPSEIARFIDVFCLRQYLWGYEIKYQNLEYYALGIYGFLEDKYKSYSNDAKKTAKEGRGHPDFWSKYLISTIYLSGLHERIDYIAPYPGHKKNSTHTVIEDPMTIFAKCFKKNYLYDLIIRHTTAIQSAYARRTQNSSQLNHYQQLNTIKLNQTPTNKKIEGLTDKYQNNPLNASKTVLIIDDFCSEGYSLEAARAYIEQTEANVICLSLLKTINKAYKQITNICKFDPFQVQQFSNNNIQTIQHPYQKGLPAQSTYQEISNKLKEYDSWQW